MAQKTQCLAFLGGRVWYRCRGVRDRQAERLWVWLTGWTGKAMD